MTHDFCSSCPIMFRLFLIGQIGYASMFFFLKLLQPDESNKGIVFCLKGLLINIVLWAPKMHNANDFDL